MRTGPSNVFGFAFALRAVVPLIAGIFEMPFWLFQFANFTSAFVWAAVLLTLLVYFFVILIDNTFARAKWQMTLASCWMVAAIWLGWACSRIIC